MMKNRQTRAGGSLIDVYHVQASLMIYLLPEAPVSPYIPGGGGWYHTRVRGQPTQVRFAPHAGAGLELFLDRHYIWNEDIDDSSRPLGQRRFSDRGYMVTAGLNYRW